MRDTLAIFSLALLFMMALGNGAGDRQDQAAANPATVGHAISVL